MVSAGRLFALCKLDPTLQSDSGELPKHVPFMLLLSMPSTCPATYCTVQAQLVVVVQAT